ncbi:hypothetical protein [Nesterenkonia marinintestina]|uniref:hypothetical protein n=1 Tax=Nesterenkonia marinintestina TaxID=2979865 RepID=UPI0021C10E51|nr:hypothetical protein [Nesterenkonia sp. GX14115]
MRHLLSVLSLLAAAVLAAAALAGHQVDALLHDEEPIREIAGDIPAQSDFGEAAGDLVVEEVDEQLPVSLPGGIDGAVRSTVASMLDSAETDAAWDEVLQDTRGDVAVRLERIFADGGGAQDMDLRVDLSPVVEAMTSQLREDLSSGLGWLPGVDESSFDGLAPEVVVDLDAGLDEDADPYTWATVAQLSGFWPAYALGSAVLLVLGAVVGRGRIRWIGLTSAGLLTAALGLWFGLVPASPQFDRPPELSEAAAAILGHVETGFRQWAQPAWWIFLGTGAVVVVVGLLGAALSPGRGSERRRRRRTAQVPTDPEHAHLARV